MTDASPRSFSVRSPLDLVALAPVVLGFHPKDSVVLLTFGSRSGRERRDSGSPHARIDLPISDADQDEVAGALVRAARDNDVGQAAVILYSADEEACTAMGARLVQGLLAVGCHVIDVLRVEGDGPRGRWCCVPDDGSGSTPFDLSTHPFVAEHVFAGRVVRRDRQELAQSLIGTDVDAALATAAAATRYAGFLLERLGCDVELGGAPPSDLQESGVLRTEARWLRRQVRSLTRPSAGDDGLEHLGAAEAGRMLVLVSLAPVRAVAWAEIHRRGAPDALPAQVALWSDLVRRAPGELRASPAALLGFAAWQLGDGALAWCAVELCLAAAPDHPLALLVADMLSAAVAPDTWDPISDDDLPVLARQP